LGIGNFQDVYLVLLKISHSLPENIFFSDHIYYWYHFWYIATFDRIWRSWVLVVGFGFWFFL